MNEPNSFEVEHILAFQYRSECVLETNVEEQHKDIDLRDSKGRGYSVKFQKAAARTGNFSFEVAQINTATGERVDGNFAKCKAFGYFLVMPEYSGVYRVYWFRAEDLHAYVFGNLSKWRTVRNTEAVRATNAGRKFDDAESVLVPVEKLASIAVHTDTFNYPALQRSADYQKFLKDNGFYKPRHARSSSTYRPRCTP